MENKKENVADAFLHHSCKFNSRQTGIHAYTPELLEPDGRQRPKLVSLPDIASIEDGVESQGSHVHHHAGDLFPQGMVSLTVQSQVRLFEAYRHACNSTRWTV